MVGGDGTVGKMTVSYVVLRNRGPYQAQVIKKAGI